MTHRIVPEKASPTSLKIPALSGTATVARVNNPIFIADLHLTGRKKKTLLAFWWFLRSRALQYDELFILGDFFEYWIGDDASKPAEPIARWLRAYAARGKRVYLMQGNRDFLLGVDFARHCGGTLLKPQVVIETPKTRILLSHGDEWCTLDTDYQAFRARMRDPEFQREGLAMSVAERIEYAKKARAASLENKTQKTAQMMDVVAEAFVADCRKYGVDQVIHGHTHRAAVHRADGCTRTVIPDWDMQGKGPRHRGWVELNSCGLPQIVLTDRWV